MTLEGKTALVTGAGRNFGRYIALELARQGAAVAVNTRANRGELEGVVKEIRDIGVKSVGVLGDVGVRADVDRMVQEATQAVGSIDILVNNVAIRPSQPFLEITEEDWRRVIDVNLYGPFYTSRALVPFMVERGWGRIINFSGAASFYGGRGRAHVTASKIGIIGLTRALALEFAPKGITANTIVPGSFDTDRTTEWHMGEGRSHPAPAVDRSKRRGPPVGRLGESQEIADLCAFLASPDAAFITGQTIHINGGEYLT